MLTCSKEVLGLTSAKRRTNDVNKWQATTLAGSARANTPVIQPSAQRQKWRTKYPAKEEKRSPPLLHRKPQYRPQQKSLLATLISSQRSFYVFLPNP
ncbi:hypothetical protein LOK49_LG04G00524 [Camellia lanceoleosa]|uniref:Uncharacterized protein n=1 Tax=Camellia lanceoleosa TaxID=1840588 RepID=A0ACC0HWS9_9ERIC|nr:hypothetical protein LOK49_LG04G00524 [Camellia lanceoleosa]